MDLWNNKNTVLRQLAIGFQVSRFVGIVFLYHIGLLVLIVAQADKDEVARVDPHLEMKNFNDDNPSLPF